MTCVLLATMMWVGQANLEQGPVVEPLPGQPAGLVVRLWIDSTRHRMYDPVYVRVTVTNTLDSAVMADCGAHKDQYTIQAGHFTYAYRGNGEYGVTEPRRMKPGDEWIVDYGILIQRLFDFEEKLSPGSLRHALYLTRAMRTLHDEQVTARRTKTVEELIKFIDTLPQIEREAVVHKLCSHYRAVAGDPASFLLCENLIQRLPKNIHGWDDFQAYQRREMGLDQPTLREDVEGAKGKEN